MQSLLSSPTSKNNFISPQNPYKIPVRINNRLYKEMNLQNNNKRQSNSVNLVPVPRQPHPVLTNDVDDTTNTLTTALLNVRSLLGKSFLVNDLIIQHKLDFLFLTETWLDSMNNAAVLIESAPPNFSFVSENRINKRGGGVAILYKGSLQCTQLSYGSFASFEYVALLLKSSPRTIFLNIYKPPSYCAVFYDNLSEMLSVICIDFDCVIVTGGLNIHVDNLEDRETKELYCVFENYGLTQHVTGPTHIKGHTLDLIVSGGLNTPKVVVTDVALSDHFCVFFNAVISVSNNAQTKIVRKRYITESTSDYSLTSFPPLPPFLGPRSMNL